MVASFFGWWKLFIWLCRDIFHWIKLRLKWLCSSINVEVGQLFTCPSSADRSKREYTQIGNRVPQVLTNGCILFSRVFSHRRRPSERAEFSNKNRISKTAAHLESRRSQSVGLGNWNFHSMEQRRKNEAVSGSIISSALSAITLQRAHFWPRTGRNNSHSIKIARCGIQLSAGTPVTKPTRWIIIGPRLCRREKFWCCRENIT